LGSLPDKYRLQSLNQVLDVLEALNDLGPDVGVSALARRLGLAKSAVHRILINLVDRGWVRRTHGGQYRLGLKLWEIGASASLQYGIGEAAAPVLLSLAVTTQETSHLAAYDHGEVIYLEKVSTEGSAQAYTRVGGRAPAYCVATGKALLAEQSTDEVQGVITAGLVKFTGATITDSAALLEELDRVRRDGFAINTGEWRAGVCGVAAVVRDRSGLAIAGIGISGPTHRLPIRRLREFAPVVVNRAKALSRVLGYRDGGHEESMG
jgi:DNA-binding IclR family transcriptional regulator